ncbi:NLRC3-like isoform X1 [Pelobates cultripes]|uniref:NLRC3-like isoform X1 n=1 Tax=Pelobates cultripes TaxID=61616 RepID=A0AAD1RTI8_PELCU|nr:NLRC3-like isoform X1 [Pelobates cultripes]
MHFVLILSLLTSTLISVSYPERVTGVLNENVILPCIVTYTEPFSKERISILWHRGTINAHKFYYGKNQEKHPSYEGRTDLFHKEIPNGNVSLLLKNVHASDAGKYTCTVFLRNFDGRKTCSIDLLVQEIHRPDSRSDDVQMNESSGIGMSLYVFIICIIVGVVVILRRRKRSRGATGR